MRRIEDTNNLVRIYLELSNLVIDTIESDNNGSAEEHKQAIEDAAKDEGNELGPPEGLHYVEFTDFQGSSYKSRMDQTYFQLNGNYRLQLLCSDGKHTLVLYCISPGEAYQYVSR